MAETQSLNLKRIAEQMSTEMLRYLYNEAVGKLADNFLEWAKEFGANIPDDQKSAALERLKSILPEPAPWPSLQIRATGQIGVNTGAPGDPSKTKRKVSTRKASEFPLLELPDGRDPPPCPVMLQSGTRANQACGRKCTRVLFEHDPETQTSCANLTCQHYFCGTHIVKCGQSTEISKLNTLEEGADPDKETVVSNAGGTSHSVPLDVLSEIKQTDEKDTKKAASATMQRLLKNVKQRADEQKKGGNNNNESK